MPMSAPNPASVTTYPSGPTSLSAILSATIDELPWAMLANGPACTNTGVPSRVCMSVGLTASFMRTVIAPATPKSSAVTGILGSFLDDATTMRPNLSRMSLKLVVRASTAMISLATVMSNCVSLVWPFSVGDCPTVIFRRNLSLVSITLFHVIVSGSMSSLTNASLSSSVKESGSPDLCSNPSLANRLIWMGEKARFPSLPAGTKRR